LLSLFPKLVRVAIVGKAGRGALGDGPRLVAKPGSTGTGPVGTVKTRNFEDCCKQDDLALGIDHALVRHPCVPVQAGVKCVRFLAATMSSTPKTTRKDKGVRIVRGTTGQMVVFRSAKERPFAERKATLGSR